MSEDELRQWVRAKMAALKLTQVALAEKAGLRQSHISGWLNCINAMSLKSKRKLVRALGVRDINETKTVRFMLFGL